MDAPITEDLNVQTFMIVWDINLKTTNKVDNIIIRSPLFSLVPKKHKNTEWIRLHIFRGKLTIKSYFSSIEELKGCTAYMIDPITCTLLDVFKGFDKFTWNQHDWREKMRFVFELEMECDAPGVQPTIWTHFITETKPGINKNDILFSLDAGTFDRTVVNSNRVAIVVGRFPFTGKHNLFIVPETENSENWNLLTVMLTKLKNKPWERYHSHTSNENMVISLGTRQLIITEIHELMTSLKDMSVSQMAAIESVIKPNLTQTKASKELQQQSMSATFVEYFNSGKFCDFTVQVGEQQVQAHKLILAAGSTKWRDSFLEDETLATIVIDDYDAGTIKQLIEYMYGIVKQPVEAPDQLLSAAYKFGVAGLKELCEVQLIKNIEMKNVVKLLLLADRCEVDVLFDKVSVFIEENSAEFAKLEDTKSMFVMHPELALKLFAKIK